MRDGVGGNDEVVSGVKSDGGGIDEGEGTSASGTSPPVLPLPSSSGLPWSMFSKHSPFIGGSSVILVPSAAAGCISGVDGCESAA